MTRLAKIIGTFFFFLTTVKAFAQSDSEVLQFSGIVVSEESETGVPGVHIYTPNGGRGTTTNIYGFFSMPVLSGDSLIVSAISFQKEQIIIPEYRTEDLTIILRLKTDTTYLPELEISPFPSEELFKEAILALRLPNEMDLKNMQNNVDQRLLGEIYRSSSIGASGNHYYFMNQQAALYNSRYQVNSISLLNPFAWSKFIKSLKKEKED